jgi:hypothetical protein
MSKKNRHRAVDDRARLETQARRAQARAVADGVAETLGLEARRGAEFAAEDDGGGRGGPYRRQPGLDWLARKGRISEAQKAAGLRYRDAFVVAQPTQSLPSTLEVQPGMSAGGPSLKALVARAEFRGRELTPREAGGGDREALRLEAVLLVALDLLAGV